ncbi:Ctr-domain-containing protein [Hypoxylon trugodes]|uniref:Ctr-domain-containing protein n=1 Tax=Hypoxylon trugodes TaxID=326681 RepID=UPI00218D1AE0|nr:Ctr-domain-containing protein [Hypoxylon trugodes]KAI1384204.1 Ctr-domain-containing protein [Hypoxylon trugodes]
MDMGSMSMSMTMPTSTATATASSAAATTTAAMSMSGTDMGMGDSHSCKISMLWNWNTVDACFITESWRITSKGMFAGSCIGVILLGILLELLRRSVKEYDRYLVRTNAKNSSVVAVASNDGNESGRTSPKPGPQATADPSSVTTAPISAGYRPKLHEQAIRALLHTAQFVVAYFLMLLAMYYNGYFIICIFIGAFIGSFAFQWEKLGGGQQTSAANEATVCCG